MIQTAIPRQLFSIGKETISGFTRHRGQWQAAALAYFTMLAIAPLIIVIVEIAGAFLGQHHAVLKELYKYLDQTAGTSAEQGIRSIVTSTFDRRAEGILAQAISWGVFFFAAIGVFTSVQGGLYIIWEVKPPKRAFAELIRTNVVAFLALVGTALLVVALICVDTVLTTSNFYPLLVRPAEFIVSFTLWTCALALLFASVPEYPIQWRSIWIGAAITALLFDIGQFVLASYLGRAALSSSYGAFGGLIAFLIWSNYSSQILFLGAELTNVLAKRSLGKPG